MALTAVAAVVITRDDATAPSAPVTAPPGTVLPTVPPSVTPTVNEGPRYRLGDAPLVAAEQLDVTDLLGMAWVQPESGSILTLQVRTGDAEGDGPLGTGATRDESFPAEQGAAWVLGPEEYAAGVGPSWLWWERPDGDVWMLTMHWGSNPLPDLPLNTRLALRDWAFSIEPGSGLPFILPNDSWDFVATQPPGPRTSVSRTFDVDGNDVALGWIDASGRWWNELLIPGALFGPRRRADQLGRDRALDRAGPGGAAGVRRTT